MEILNMRESLDNEKLAKAIEAICKGKLVIFPTDTVYGIGANAQNEEAVRAIFRAKKRPLGNPLILLVDDVDMAMSYVNKIGKTEQILINHFWPGPLTIIFEGKGNLSNVVTGGLTTIGIRIPDHEIARELIRMVGCPLAAPSANISGSVSGTQIEDIESELGEAVSYMIDDGLSKIGIESTIVTVIGDVVHILRQGNITKEQMEQLGLVVEIENRQVTKKKENLNPSAHLNHYQIQTKCEMIPYTIDNTTIMQKEIKKYHNQKVVVMTYEEKKESYKGENVTILVLGRSDKLEQVSAKLYTTLRKVDACQAAVCLIEGVEEKGMGIVLMDKIKKICLKNK